MKRENPSNCIYSYVHDKHYQEPNQPNKHRNIVCENL